MTEMERKQVLETTEIDLITIAKDPKYLIFKFNELTDRDMEDVLDLINSRIIRNRKSKNTENCHVCKVIEVNFKNEKCPKNGGAH